MKKILLLILVAIMIVACGEKNPLLNDFGTPFETPDFSKIKKEHYLPAYEKAIEKHNAEINAILSSKEEPTFNNTIIPLEESGILLAKVEGIFGNLYSADGDEEMRAIADKVFPMISKHSDDINLNPELFARVKSVYENQDKFGLTDIQKRLLEKYYKGFVRGGANLSAEAKDEYRKINDELTILTKKFGDNVLNEVNSFKLVIDKKEDLEGLTEGAISAAAETAEKEGQKGKWIFTISKPSLIPFLQNSAKRELREKMYNAYINQGNNNDQNDNKKILSKIAALRVKKANLLGYKSFADFVLEERMAKTSDNVFELLLKLWKPALERAKAERAEMQKMINNEGDKFQLAGGDWFYYAEKVKKAKYDLDEEMLRPYFELNNVREGAFAVASKLYGIKFKERKDIPVYHPDVKVFEVLENDDSHIGILYVDYFPRATKRGGAWMNSYRKQAIVGGKNISPIICNVCNFSKPTGDKPALLSFDEVQTLFHEFGHALHGLLSKCEYNTLSGTAVTRDFVELPSQIMENWAGEPEVMKMYAKHYKTGEIIPDELIEKLEKAGHFNQGFRTVEYLAASFLDMYWHSLEDAKELDAAAFEKEKMDELGLIDEIVSRYKSPYFRHVFSGGYSAGYYSYIWAEVLDADAFEAFKENGLFDQKTATAFRENVLSKGGTEEAMELYIKFRGKEPGVEPLLKRRGLK